MLKQGLILVLLVSFLLAGCSGMGSRKPAGFPPGHDKHELG